MQLAITHLSRLRNAFKCYEDRFPQLQQFTVQYMTTIFPKAKSAI